MYYEKILLTRHARQRLSRINCINVYELVRNGKVVKKCRKEGEVGTIEVKMRKRTILIEFTLRKNKLYVITIKTR